MKFHILTLFPEMIMQGLNTSIIGRAVEKNILSINAVDIRDYTLDKHGKVDDYPYGGGAGMLMQAQPVYDAWKAVTGKSEKRIRTIYVTPQGHTFDQKMAAEFRAEHGTITCRELLVTLKPTSTPTPSARTEEYYRVRPCVRFVATAADILDRMIAGEF